MSKQEMLKQVELDLELQGFSVIKVDGKTYLHIRMSHMLATDMTELINKNDVYKIIFHQEA